MLNCCKNDPVYHKDTSVNFLDKLLTVIISTMEIRDLNRPIAVE